MSSGKPGLADWLSLGAAPVFASLGLITAVAGDPHAAMLCSEGGEASPFSGMGTMYLLMALFHLTPWLKRLSPRRG